MHLTRNWYQLRFGELRPDWYIFPFGKPRPNDPTRPVTTLKTAWRNLREKAGVQGRWHDNRHTLISDLAESGASDQTIMDIAGHVSKQMLRHDSHIRMEAKRAALESIVQKDAPVLANAQQVEAGYPQKSPQSGEIQGSKCGKKKAKSLIWFGEGGRNRTYNPSVNSRISGRSGAKWKTQVIENRRAIACKPFAVSHGFQEKFVQKFVQSGWR